MKLKEVGCDYLLQLVHERTGLGVDITTWVDGTIEVKWKRDYGDEGWSDERFFTAPTIHEALQGVLDHEDAADREDSYQERKP